MLKKTNNKYIKAKQKSYKQKTHKVIVRTNIITV